MLFGKNDIGVKTNNQEEKAEGNSSAFISKFLNIQTDIIENLSEDLVRLPEPGEVKFLQTIKAFNGFTFVEMISRLNYIEELTASTYSISMKVVEALQEMKRLGKIDKINLMISDSMMKRNPKVSDSINAWASLDPMISVVYSWNHSKVVAIRTETDYYTIEGSGNWGENACYEQYVLVNDESVYNLRKRLFSECKVVFKIN